MVRHFFLDKCNTIFKDKAVNLGYNPVAELNYGKDISRILIHFNGDEIKSLVENHTFSNLEKLNVVLKMTNCTNINGVDNNRKLSNGTCEYKERASSYNILAIELPEEFDGGCGFEHSGEIWESGKRAYSESGSNWYQAYNGKVWGDGDRKFGDGVYNIEYIKEEYDKFSRGEESIIINRQHFDVGNEDLNIDITNYIKQILEGKPNNGLLLMFTPGLEETETDIQQYVGFFTEHTNTFFHPYIEVIYDEVVNDDRESMHIGKTNRLYLYCYVDGEYQNLDKLPTCTIDGVEYEVKQATKGIYYTELKLDCEKGDLLSDVWSDLYIGGEKVDDVELDFIALGKSSYFKIGNDMIEQHELVPSISGINDDEELGCGEVREVSVDFRLKYTTDIRETVNKAEYRLYVKDGKREIDIYNGYQPIEKHFLYNCFILNTNDLIPNNYFVDVRVTQNRDVKYYKNVLRFKIVDNITKR